MPFSEIRDELFIRVEKTRFVSGAVFVLLALMTGASWAATPPKPETPHLAFVTEYIRELAAIEAIRDSGKQELKGSDDTEKLSSGIHINTMFQLELQSEVGMLKSMRLNPPFNELIPQITSFYDLKITVFKRMTEILSTMIAASGQPKPTIDYEGETGLHRPDVV